MTASPGLRERKKARVRETLVATALRLFRRHGYEATTVDDIAAAAGVSRRSFFRYFPSKEAVVFPDRAERLTCFAAALRERGAGTEGFARVRHACEELARRFTAERDRVLEQLEVLAGSPALVAHERQLDRSWEDAIAEALMAAAPRRTAAAARRTRILAGAVLGAMQATLRLWAEAGGRTDLIELGRDAFDLLERGIDSVPERRTRGRP